MKQVPGRILRRLASNCCSEPACDARVKNIETQERTVFTTLSRVSCLRQLSKVVLGCVTDWQQETRGLFRMESFMVTDPASGIRHEVQQLIQLQIDTLRLESSLTSSQLWEYRSRFVAFARRSSSRLRHINQERTRSFEHDDPT